MWGARLSSQPPSLPSLQSQLAAWQPRLDVPTLSGRRCIQRSPSRTTGRPQCRHWSILASRMLEARTRDLRRFTRMSSPVASGCSLRYDFVSWMIPSRSADGPVMEHTLAGGTDRGRRPSPLIARELDMRAAPYDPRALATGRRSRLSRVISCCAPVSVSR